MAITRTEDGNLVTLLVDGTLESTLGATLRADAGRALAAGRRRFLVNLQKTKTANSAGLEALVHTARAVNAGGGRLALVGPNSLLADILKATRLDQRFAVFDSTEQALREMRAEI